MAHRKPEGRLTDEERRIVKGLILRGWRNQDIQDIINRGRKTTINNARVTEIKQNQYQKSSSDSELDFFLRKKRSFDFRTGLNIYDDERLVRAREAMIMAVHTFNSPNLHFKTELFSVLVTIAWTYLLHYYFLDRGYSIHKKNGQTVELRKMIYWDKCPITKAMRQNLEAVIDIRNEVEHRLLKNSDLQLYSIFQATCLNFDKVLRAEFGEDTSLTNEMTFSLQFSKPNIQDLSTLGEYDIPEYMQALDARLRSDKTEEELADLEYQFRIIYTLDSSSKSKAHFHFVNPDSQEAEEIKNILVKRQPSDELYPFRVKDVIREVKNRTGKKFTQSDHTICWKYFKVRPAHKSLQPENTNRDYCIYHTLHQDYSYSQKWIDLLSQVVSDDGRFDKIKNSFRKPKKGS